MSVKGSPSFNGSHLFICPSSPGTWLTPPDNKLVSTPHDCTLSCWLVPMCDSYYWNGVFIVETVSYSARRLHGHVFKMAFTQGILADGNFTVSPKRIIDQSHIPIMHQSPSYFSRNLYMCLYLHIYLHPAIRFGTQAPSVKSETTFAKCIPICWKKIRDQKFGWFKIDELLITTLSTWGDAPLGPKCAQSWLMTSIVHCLDGDLRELLRGMAIHNWY